jgi:hypothetical protein
MLVYLDTADLINICRGSAPIELPDLAQRLVSGGHKIVLSLDTLIEVAAPLRNGRLLEVRRTLNRVEELPHTFINEVRIRDMEMREALSAFEHGREYDFASVSPFASRLDDAIDVQRLQQYVIQNVGGRRVRIDTHVIVNLRIWDVIIHVFRRDPEAFNVQRRREQEWIAVMEADRILENPPELSVHFVTTMNRNLQTHGLRHQLLESSRLRAGCTSYLLGVPAFGWLMKPIISFAGTAAPGRARPISSTWVASPLCHTSTFSWQMARC